MWSRALWQKFSFYFEKFLFWKYYENDCGQVESDTFKLLWFNLSITSLCKTQVHWFISSILIYSYSYLIFMNLETWVVHRIFKRNLNFFFKSQPSLNQHEKYQADWTNLSWDIAVLRFCNLICHEHLWPNSIKKLLFPFLNMPYKTFTNHLLFFLIYT